MVKKKSIKENDNVKKMTRGNSGLIRSIKKNQKPAKKPLQKLDKNKILLKSLRDERNLLRTLIDNLPDAIFVKDKNCRKIIANPTDVHNLGLKSEADLLGKDDFDFFPKDIAEKFYADDKAVISTGKPVLKREEYFLDKKGEKQWLLTSKLPLKNSKNKIIGIIGIGRDITIRKHLKDSLEKERNILRTLIDNIPDLIFFKDVQGRYILNNLAHLRSLGVKNQEDTLGKSTFDFNPPELSAQYVEDEKKIISSGMALIEKEEMAIHRDTGKLYWHLTSKIPLIDANGNATGIVGISRDITQHKENEEKIYKLNRVYEILSNVNQTVVRTRDKQLLFDDICKIAVMDGKLKMAWVGLVDKKTRKIIPAANYGYTGDYFINLDIQIDGIENVNNPTAIAIETMEYCISNNIELDPRMKNERESALKNGYRSLCVLPLKVFGEAYAIIYLFNDKINFFDEEEMRLLEEMSMDVSFCIETIFNEEKRKKYEDELLHAKTKAEEVNRLKNSFLARMSHELRTPLNVILGSCSILKEFNTESTSESLRNLFDSVEEESFRLLTAMNEVFDISSIESRTFTVDIKPVSINKIAASTYENLISFAKKKNLHLVLNRPETRVIVSGDNYCLKGVMEIVLHNAIKFSDQGTIVITVDSENGFGICSISDEGVGMSEEYQKQLFELFSQEDAGYSRQFDGLGLGLVLAQKYINFMNGSMKIDSKKGEGTTVTIRIPLHKGE